MSVLLYTFGFIIKLCLLVTTQVFGFVVGDSVCYPGTYLTSHGTCALCPRGMYSMQAGATVCFACMRGSFADHEGMSQCVLSGMGDFVPNVGQNQSFPCSPGSFQYIGGSSSCLSCRSGSFQRSYGATVCEMCAAGTFQPEDGGSVCHQCGAGSYSLVEGGTVCSLCPVGSFQPELGATDCTICQAGSVQPNPGRVSCLSCQGGSFQPSVGMTACMLCSNGTFQASSGASGCVACPMGTYLTASGASSPEKCVDCNAGTYSTIAGSALCLACAAGSFTSVAGMTVCDACPAGTYQPQTAQTVCVKCHEGTYGGLIGASDSSTCVPCKPGTYSMILGASDEAVCIRCPPGHFSADSGASSLDACLQCSEGTLSALDGTHCPACEDGTFCPAGSVAPILCRNERLVCNRTHLMALPGYLAVLVEGNCTGVIPCPRGTLCHLQIPEHAGVLPAIPDPSSAVAPYYVVYAPGPEQISLDCPWSTFFYGIRKVEQQVSEEPLPGVLFRLQAMLCPAGTFLLEDECVQCPTGFFSATEGAYSRNACLACSSGMFGDSPGLSACLACSPGNYQSLEGATSCVACSAGTYQKHPQSSACTACVSGTFLPHEAGTSCLLCDAGKMQANPGGTACLACSSAEFSSPGDALCTQCGVTPSVQAVCPLSDAPWILGDTFYLSVRGEKDDTQCLAMGLSQFIPGTPAHLSVPVHHLLHQDVRCHHTLSVMGRPDLARVWTTEQRQIRPASSLRVLPYGAELNLAVCEEQGFAVSFVLQDEYGGYAPDLTGAEATLAFLAPDGDDLLFWTLCEQLPSRGTHGSGILIGTCTAHNFCPTMDVIARVTTSWPGGYSVKGEHALVVERARPCPPSSSWIAVARLETPGRRFGPGDSVVVLIQVENLPEQLASFSFSLRLREGLEFVSFQSVMSTSFHVSSEQVLSVEGDSTTNTSALLGTLVLRVGSVEAGILRALRVDTDNFRVTFTTGGVHILRVMTQGYACRMDGALLLLVRHQEIHALVARITSPVLVDWQALQDSAAQSQSGIEAVGIWNVRGRISVVEAIQCSPLTPGKLLIRSCSSIQALTGQSGGTARVKVQFAGVSTLVDLPVLVPWNATVSQFAGTDGLSGRFKVLAQFRYGDVLDRFQAQLDVTPYLRNLPAQGVTLRGEEWACLSDGPFSVGAPVLFEGSCHAIRLRVASPIPYFFSDEGCETGLGRFVLGPSFLHPSASSGVILFFSEEFGLLPDVPDAALDGMGRFSVDWRMRVSLNATGMSPWCIRLPGAYRIPVLPASPTSLQVVLETATLVTQHDIWGLLPSSTSLAQAWLELSDGVALDVRMDSRLYWESAGDLDVVTPGAGVMSRGVAGNFTVTFGLHGIPCVRAEVVVQVHPYSTKTATLVCRECPAVIAKKGDPMARHFPDRFPSSIQPSAFVVQYLLVDGSVKEKPCDIIVQGAGILQDGVVYGLEPGVVLVTTDAARGSVEIPVVDQWLQSCELLCNEQSCAAPDLRLTVPGDGAALAPFWYTPMLVVTLRLVINGGVVLQSPLLDGMYLEVDGDRIQQAPTLSLAPGERLLSLASLLDYGVTLDRQVVRVDIMQSLVVRGPPVLFQIHCSRVWEQGWYSVTAVLTDGTNATLPANATLESDGRILAAGTGDGGFWAQDTGEGWVRASFGGRSVVYAVQATRTSKYFTSISVQRFPEVWTARFLQAIPLVPKLTPEYQVRNWTHVHLRVLRWSASVPGVVQFSNDTSSMRLLSDYHSGLQISCVLLACMAADMQIDQQELWVNMAPSVTGQIDLGEEVGRPISPVAVGDVQSIPVFIFAKSRIRAYSIRIVFDHIALVPVDCSGGELFQSSCSLSNSSDAFLAEANFSSSQRSGRILVAHVRGRVTLDTVSQIHVLVRQVVVGDGMDALGPVAYRFSIRLGMDPMIHRFTQPYLNRVGPLLLPLHGISPYPGDDEPSVLTVCCDIVVAHASARLSKHFPSVFVISAIALGPGNFSLDAVDPRVRLVFDQDLLEFDPEQRMFVLIPGVAWPSGSPRVGVVYTHPGTLGTLQAEVRITLAQVASLRLTPEELEIKRIHCSQTVFGNATIMGELVLTQNLGVIPLEHENVHEVSVDDPSVAELLAGQSQGFFLVHGLSPGITDIRFNAYRLQGTVRVLVHKKSYKFEAYDLQPALILSGCWGQSVRIPVTGRLEDGTVLSQLDRFIPVIVNVVGPIEAQAANLSLKLLGNTVLDDSSMCHVSLHMPACEGSPEATVQAYVTTRLVTCIDPYHQPADVEISGVLDGGVTLRLVGRGVMAFYVHVRVDPSPGTVCRPVLPGDCSVGQDSTVIIAGVASAPFDTLEIATVSPVSRLLWGFVEVFSGISSVRVPIVAARLGQPPLVDPVKTLMPELPVVDTAVLSRGMADSSNTQYTLDLMTDRQRLVDPRSYSDNQELSLMFRVTDRFLAPDDSHTRVHVIFPASLLPLLPGAESLPGGGQRVPAPHVKDGWYAVQWQGSVPAVSLDLEFDVTTSTSRQAQVWPWPGVTLGVTFHECPRAATQRASFLVEYRVFMSSRNDRWVADHLICAIHVARRRIRFSGFNSSNPGWGELSLALESFIRVQEVHEKIMSPWFNMVLHTAPEPPLYSAILRRRALPERPEIMVLDERKLSYINDTEDGPTPCPPGMFFSQNGTYVKLPMHAKAREDCYGMTCVHGYRLQDQSSCVPEDISMDVVWISVIVIVCFVVFLICVFCCLRMARASRTCQSPKSAEVVQQGPSAGGGMPVMMGQDPFDDVFPEHEWGGRVQLDDYSSTMLDDPSLHSPLPFGNFRR